MRPSSTWALPFAVCVVVLSLAAGRTAAQQFPRIANLWGASPSEREVGTWSRYGLLVLGGGSREDWARFSAEARRRNPDIVLLGTTPLTNLGAPAATPWMKDEWFLRRPDGSFVRWWADQIYSPNLLTDACLDALVANAEREYGALVRDKLADGYFCDSVVGGATWLGPVDTDRDGVADLPADVDSRWHERQNEFFDRIRARFPTIRYLANDVDLGHAPHLNGRLFEGAPLLDRVAGGSLSAREAIDILNTWTGSSRQPSTTFAIMTHPIGWQGWRVGVGSQVTTRGEQERARRDFRRMRLGLCTALMTNAYYSYDLGTVWYGLKWWYGEYDARLGKAQGPAKEVLTRPRAIVDWRAGQPVTGFVLDPHCRVTREGVEATIGAVDNGWARLFGTDPARTPFEPRSAYSIDAECVVLRKPSGLFQFNVRTATGGWEKHDKAVATNTSDAGATWRIRATLITDDYPDYAAEWHLNGAGALRLTRLTIRRVDDSYFRRDFEGGVALLNPMPIAVTVPLDGPLWRIDDPAAPRFVVEVDDEGPGFTATGAWQARGGEGRFVGAGWRTAAKPGARATWRFTPPSSEVYTISACIAGGKDLTDSAVYTIRQGGRSLVATRSQRPCDGGWTPLGDFRLKAGEQCSVALISGGTGVTVADAIRAESKSRYNDGSRTRSVRLDPLDGVVLVKSAPAKRRAR